MKNPGKHVIPAVSYFFILLFCYAAISKIMDFENFRVQIGQSPILSAYAGLISYAVIITEMIIVILLVFTGTRRIGLYASTALMSAFSIYIFLILNYSDFVPCSCGGILEKMGWNEHLIFNISTVAAGIAALIMRSGNENLNLKFTLTILLITNIVSIALVSGLFLSSDYIIRKENNFTRKFLPHPVQKNRSFLLENTDYYFAGVDANNIYLGNRKFPQKLLIFNQTKNMLDSIQIVPDKLDLPFKDLRIYVKDSYFYLADGTVPVIFRGKIGNTTAKAISYQDAYFSHLEPVDSVTFVIRTHYGKTNQLSLGLIRLQEKQKVKLYPDILKKQTDGVFDSDGKLTSSLSEKLAYVYSYRNRFIISDGDLHAYNEYKTIDTTSQANIKTVKLSNGLNKKSRPAMTVNQNIALYRNVAMIQSRLKAKNELPEVWKSNDVIDIYRTDRQEYLGSFYINKVGNKTLSHYLPTDRNFYVITGNQLIVYNYNKSFNIIIK